MKEVMHEKEHITKYMWQCIICQVYLHPPSHGCSMSPAAIENSHDKVGWCTACWQKVIDKQDDEAVKKQVSEGG